MSRVRHPARSRVAGPVPGRLRRVRSRRPHDAALALRRLEWHGSPRRPLDPAAAPRPIGTPAPAPVLGRERARGRRALRRPVHARHVVDVLHHLPVAVRAASARHRRVQAGPTRPRADHRPARRPAVGPHRVGGQAFPGRPGAGDRLPRCRCHGRLRRYRRLDRARLRGPGARHDGRLRLELADGPGHRPLRRVGARHHDGRGRRNVGPPSHPRHEQLSVSRS